MSDYVEPYRLRTLLVAYALLVCASVVAAQEPLTPEQWREDLRHMAEQMPREHKNLYHTMTEAEFLKAVQELDAQIPTLERHEIIVGLARIVAMVRDGHTGIKGFVPDQGVGFRSYPIRLYAYEDGLFVQEAHREFADMLGGKVVRIGSVSTAEAVDIVGKLVPRDNDMGLTSRAPYYLASPELLHAVGIIDDMEAATFVVEREGRRETFVLSPLSSTRPRLQRGFFEDVPDWIDVRDNANAVPLWLQHHDVPYWFEYMEPEKTVYVQYSECVNSGDETVAEFFDRVSTFVESTDVNRFILDLRLNGGGTSDPNTSIVLSTIKSKIDQPGKFFVIIGRRTFSAAQNLVNKLEEYTNAIFVGEPTSQHVQFYSDAATIVLPNSKLRVRVSALWFQVLSPLDTRVWTVPQIAARLTSDDYRSGRDPAVEAILNYRPRAGLAELLSDALGSNDLLAMRKVYFSFREDPANAYVDTESILNGLGYRLMGDDRIAAAIEAFKLNVESHPVSANGYDSLGEAYLKHGDIELAKQNYERAVELDPHGRVGENSRNALEAMGKNEP